MKEFEKTVYNAIKNGTYTTFDTLKDSYVHLYEEIELLQAKNARLTKQLENAVVLPFKNGDTIYTVCLKKNGHTEDFIGEFHITDDCDFEIWARENTRGYLIHKSRKGIKYNKKCSNFGKYWFLTKSEAEARLAELKEVEKC